jgi:putative transposase
MITGATLYKEHFYDNTEKLSRLRELLFETAHRFGWNLEAWSLFSNHYHLISCGTDSVSGLSRWIQRFHSVAGEMVNLIDDKPGRRIWYQYWDKCLTFESSYWPRLNYVTHNPVKHGLVQSASDYPFCSARWIELRWSSALRKKLKSFRWERIREFDEFDPIPID